MTKNVTIEKDLTWERLQEKLLETNCLKSDILNLVKQISRKFPDATSRQFVEFELERMCNQLINHKGVIEIEPVTIRNGVYYYDFGTKTDRKEIYYANVLVDVAEQKEKFHVYEFNYETGDERAATLKRKANGDWYEKRYSNFSELRTNRASAKVKTLAKV